MPPSMAPLLGRPTTTGPATASRLNRRTAGTVVEGLVIAAVAYRAITRLESVLHASPHLAPLLLLLAVATLALLLPLCVFLGCQAEFAADVVPWTPRGFVLIARRTFAAFAANADTGKVEGKDL